MAKRFLGLEWAEWWFWLKWVLVNAVGWALDWFGPVGFTVVWAVVGTAQWLVLRKRVQRASWWVLASAR